MSELDDHDLLARYARENSQAAFAALVDRHIHLVHSVACRSVGNAHAAEEITQAVFIILAQKAGRISRKTILSGWLHQTARLTAANFLRGEIRRQKREQEAYMQSTLNQPDAGVWPHIAPLLDDALAKLGARDRDALVLRFFENKTFREVGIAAGIGEDAAKMRVSRALDKLRKIFTKHGVMFSAAVIAGAVTGNSVQAAPAGLAKTISAVAVAKGAAATTSTLTLVKGVLKIMAWTKAKTAIVAGTVVILVGTATPVAIHVVQQHRALANVFSSKTELTDGDIAKLQQQTGATPAEAAQNFFDACGKNDWAAADRFWQTDSRNKNAVGAFPDGFKKSYGGLEIITLGKPFKARLNIAALVAVEPHLRQEFRGRTGDFEASSVFVPYEMKLKDGSIRKWQLSIRCDNPQHRWYYDGGM